MKKRRILKRTTNAPILTAIVNNITTNSNKPAKSMRITPMNEKQLLMKPEQPSDDE